ncbi:MAG: hypothetical protein J6D47_10250 [Peptostreptococcaceae bacterium]|nr:hypothetical protein [Peptostreptococcaceae bacterium]
MIKREENILNNSIAYNVFNDNLVAKNYLALAYCVVGIEFNKKRYYPTITETCRAFELLENSNKSNVKENNNEVNIEIKPREYKKRADTKVIVTNTLTDEDTVYSSTKEVSKALGLQHNRIYNYIYAGTRYKNIYQIRFEDMEKHKLKPLRQKRVKLINKITNEVIIKDSMKEAAKFLNCSQDYITYLAKKKKARRDGWTVEKI